MKRLALVTLLFCASIAVPTAAADHQCPPPGEPSPNLLEGAAQTAQTYARAACVALDFACEAAGIDGDMCWITLE